MNKDEMKNRISMALKDPILQQGFEIICKNIVELSKENAELKEQNEATENGAKKYAQYFFETNEQLTKAKKIIRDLLSCLYSVEYDKVSDLEEEEQFLSDNKQDE